MILHIFRIANQHLLEHLQYRAKNMNHAFIGNPLDLKWGREHVLTYPALVLALILVLTYPLMVPSLRFNRVPRKSR